MFSHVGVEKMPVCSFRDDKCVERAYSKGKIECFNAVINLMAYLLFFMHVFIYCVIIVTFVFFLNFIFLSNQRLSSR